MSVLSLRYIEAPLVKGKRLFRGKEEVGLIRNEDFERFKKEYGHVDNCQEPPIQLHPSQFTIRNAPEEDLDPAEVAKNVTDAMNNFADAVSEFNDALKNSTWKDVNNNDQ